MRAANFIRCDRQNFHDFVRVFCRELGRVSVTKTGGPVRATAAATPVVGSLISSTGRWFEC